MCGYPVLHFHFAYNSCVKFRTRGLCKRSVWWDVMRAVRLACRGTCGDYELISVSFVLERLVRSLIYNLICNLKTWFSVNGAQLVFPWLWSYVVDKNTDFSSSFEFLISFHFLSAVKTLLFLCLVLQLHFAGFVMGLFRHNLLSWTGL